MNGDIPKLCVINEDSILFQQNTVNDNNHGKLCNLSISLPATKHTKTRVQKQYTHVNINDYSNHPQRVKKPKYKFNVNPIHHNDYYNPLTIALPGAPGPVYTPNDVLTASRQEKRGRMMRNKRAALFEQWMALRRVDGLYAPTWSQLYQKFDKEKFSNLIFQYTHWRFNFTKNVGTTLDEDIRAVKYLCSLNGIFISMSDFPWRGQYERGANQISTHAFGKAPGEQKYALFNPIIEAMIKSVGNDEVSKLGILLAQRFCMRSQHYCNTDSDVDLIKYGTVFFNADKNGKILSMTWRYKWDKNHKKSSPAKDRTIFCTCNTEWTCLPCFAFQFIEWNKYFVGKKDNDPLFSAIGSDQPITYRTWYDKTKKILKGIGLDSSNYALHSYRAGGASEKDIEGATPIDIQHFGDWDSLESVYEYIRRGNPDMVYFVPSMEEYIRYRRKQAGTSDEILKDRKKQIDNYIARQLALWKKRPK